MRCWSSHWKHVTAAAGGAVHPDLPLHTSGLPWPMPPTNTHRVENPPNHPPVLPDPQVRIDRFLHCPSQSMTSSSSSLEGRRRTGAGGGDCAGSGSGWRSISEKKATPVRKRAVSALWGRHPHRVTTRLPEMKGVGQVAHCRDTTERDLT